MKTGAVIGVLVLVVLAAGGGFVGGTLNSHGQIVLPVLGTIGSAQPNIMRFGNFDPSQMSAEQLQQFQQLRQGRGTPGAGGDARQGGDAGFVAGGAMGTIQSIENGVLTVQTQSGTTMKVTATDTTLIQKQMSVKLDDLQVGEQVVVSGSPAADGTTTARSIRVMAARGQ